MHLIKLTFNKVHYTKNNKRVCTRKNAEGKVIEVEENSDIEDETINGDISVDAEGLLGLLLKAKAKK